MKQDDTRISIEQAIPFELFNKTLIEFLNSNNINKEELLEKTKIYNKGNNRAKKVVNAIYSTITKKSILIKVLKKTFTVESYNKLLLSEKNTISMALICLRFPFMWNTLVTFAKLFYIQDKVNRQYLIQKLSTIYGSNLPLEHGLAATIQMAIDGNFIIREKPGLFSKKEPDEICNFAKESWLYVWFEMNNRKPFCIDDLYYEPIMTFIPNTDIDWNNTKLLSTKEDFSRRIWIDGIK